MVMKRIVWKLFVVIAIFVMAGCAAPEVKQRFYWPPLPDEPKIEWLGAYRSKLDMPVTPFEKFMQAIMGKPSAVHMNRPIGIASDGGDKVYVSDTALKNVFQFDFKKRDVKFLNLEQSDTPVFYKHAAGLAVDREKNIYICDSIDKHIYVISPDEKLVRYIDISQQTKQPVGLVIDNERKRLIVADTRAQQLFVYELEGKFLFSIGIAGGGDVDGAFNMPGMPAVMRNGNIVVPDSMNARVLLFDSDGKFIRKIGSRGDGPGQFQLIKAAAVDSENHIYITDAKANCIHIYSESGEYLLTLGGSYTAELTIAPGGFLIPQGIFIDENDTIYVADQMNGRFQMFQYMNERYLKEHPVDPAASGVAR